MSVTRNVFGQELKEKLLSGVEKLNASVSFPDDPSRDGRRRFQSTGDGYR